MRNVLDKILETIKTCILYSVSPPPRDNRAVYEIMRTSTDDPDKPQMTIWRMRIACWKSKTTNTHSKYAVFTALPLKKWLHGKASLLCYTCTACLVYILYV